MASETNVCRQRMSRFCEGSGLDLGCGGDLIALHAIGVDLPVPYTRVGAYPIHLRGDARKLWWFVDECLDFVFSSHLLEDFSETEPVLREWARVVKPGGNVVIYGPDEKVYRKHCWDNGQPYNKNHSIDDFGAAHVAGVIERMPELSVIHRVDHCDTYGFEIVARKA